MAKNQVKRIPKKQENPFEKFANSKKKHEVINRRVKGEDRNVGRARGKVFFILIFFFFFSSFLLFYFLLFFFLRLLK